MYFNNVHILWYVLLGGAGAILGQFIDYSSKVFIKNSSIEEFVVTEGKETCAIKEKRIFSKETLKEYRKGSMPNYILIISMVLSYICLIYKFGVYSNFMENIELIKYILLIPILFCAFYVDLKEQIIPNRLNLMLFEIGLVFVFISGCSNINVAIDMLLGMLAGGGIFVLITLIGGLIAGKEAMGLGDVKLMGALGLFFGLNRIIAISVMAFLIGAVISVVLMVFRTKKSDEYIPFGPFIVIATIIAIFVPFTTLFNILMSIFTLGMFNTNV